MKCYCLRKECAYQNLSNGECEHEHLIGSLSTAELSDILAGRRPCDQFLYLDPNQKIKNHNLEPGQKEERLNQYNVAFEITGSIEALGKDKEQVIAQIKTLLMERLEAIQALLCSGGLDLDVHDAFLAYEAEEEET